MKTISHKGRYIAFLLVLIIVQNPEVKAQDNQTAQALDKKVSAFLNANKSDWHNWNVPYEDGKVLYDIIVNNKYKSALEIGTSTGHSTIWLAWAMSKTGGKVITVEIDEGRYKIAKENIRKAGLEQYVDARLADAHTLVKQLPGPFDFVFSDADKDWYTQYFIDVDPKLLPGGCFTAHNVNNTYGGAGDFLDHIKKNPNYRTTVDKSSSSGISISYKSKP